MMHQSVVTKEVEIVRKLKKSELKRVYGAKDGTWDCDPEQRAPGSHADTDCGESTGGDGADD